MNPADFSATYQKYVVTIRVNKVEYFTVWGVDLSDGDKDKVLVTEHNKIVLLQNNDFKAFFNESKNLDSIFDKSNFLQWVESKAPKSVLFKSHAKYDFDLLGSLVFNDKISRSAVRDVFDSILFFSDYAYQIRLNEFLKVYESKTVSAFRDFVYALEIWHTETIPNKLFKNNMYNTRLSKAVSKMHVIMLASMEIR